MSEKLKPIRLALENALHDLTFSNGLLVTDLPNPDTTFTLDNSKSITLLEIAITELNKFFDTDKIQDIS